MFTAKLKSTKTPVTAWITALKGLMAIDKKIEPVSPNYFQFKEYVATQFAPSYNAYDKMKENFTINLFQGKLFPFLAIILIFGFFRTFWKFWNFRIFSDFFGNSFWDRCWTVSTYNY